MQYCSLKHRILLSSPDISTTGHRFHSGPATSFFLGLLVVVANWTLSNLRDSHLSVIFFVFLYSSWGVEKQRHYSDDKGSYSQGYGLPSVHVQLWELDCKEGRTPKRWCLWTVVLEKTPEGPLDSKEIKQSILREVNPEYLLEGLILKLQYFGHLMWTADSLEKTLMFGMIEDRGRKGHQRMRGWHHWCNGHESGQTSGDGEGQGSLACCSPWGCKESDTTGWLNNHHKVPKTVPST